MSFSKLLGDFLKFQICISFSKINSLGKTSGIIFSRIGGNFWLWLSWTDESHPELVSGSQDLSTRTSSAIWGGFYFYYFPFLWQQKYLHSGIKTFPTLPQYILPSETPLFTDAQSLIDFVRANSRIIENNWTDAIRQNWTQWRLRMAEDNRNDEEFRSWSLRRAIQSAQSKLLNT